MDPGRLPQIFCLVGWFAVAPFTLGADEIAIHGETMGTTYVVKLVGENVDADSFGARINARLESINEQMSTWRPQSQISRFNRLRTTRWFSVSEDFIRVLNSARAINVQTDGAFDITLGKLIELWGFGSDSPTSWPDSGAISSALRHTGPGKFEVDDVGNSIRKTDPETQLDLSAIAKGYAVDALAEIIEDEGVRDFLVEIGGEVRASGRRGDGALWRVAVETPDAGGRSVQVVVELDNAAIATSGDYRRFFQLGARRYAHIIDPGTGKPTEHALASVSVIAGDAMTADALATALMVMGRARATAFATRTDTPALMIERRDDQYVVHSTDLFNGSVR